MIPLASQIFRAIKTACVLAGCFLFLAQPAQAAAKESSLLRIENQGETDILNILLAAGKKDFFLRLDLPPHSANKFENPNLVANMRVDCGLYLLFFDKVPLPNALTLVFGGDSHDLAVDLKDGSSIHLEGRRENIIPQPGSRPVCELSQFKPGMTMGDVCDLLPENAPRDDNGAVIAGLGFAGQLWAARLYPGKDGMLEHLELRKPLLMRDLKALIAFLRKKDYVPWQAEFPGLDVDFAEMPQNDPHRQWDFLDGALANLMKDKKGEATVMFAPEGSLPALADADDPARDVQLFTLSVRPATNLVLLDVAAYKGRQ